MEHLPWQSGTIESLVRLRLTLGKSAPTHVRVAMHRDRSCVSVKAKIHPRYQTCTVHCACGNNFTTRSTMAKINVDICSQCHPFFTGKQKFVDTAGRVERFSKKFGGSYSFQKTSGTAAPAGAGAAAGAKK
jgi:large subunit ribosomal protein L31